MLMQLEALHDLIWSTQLHYYLHYHLHHHHHHFTNIFAITTKSAPNKVYDDGTLVM